MVKKLLKILNIIFKRDIIKRLIFAFKTSLQISSLYPIEKFQKVNIGKSVEDFTRHLSTTRYYANLIGAKYLYFLQPFNGIGRKNLSLFDSHSIAHIKSDEIINSFLIHEI
jgi:hypothetical protein